MQQGMLFHSLGATSPGVDIEQVVGTMNEPLEVAAFERAWNMMTERHPILRTGFYWDAGDTPRQVVHGPLWVPVHQLRWPHASEQEMAEGLEEYLRADRNRSFKLDEPPLFRLALIQGGPAQWRFVFTFHHLLLDIRALTVVLREVFAYYEAFAADRTLNLPPPPSYWNYIEWLGTLDPVRQEKFWRERLQGLTAPSLLSIAHSPGEVGGSGAPVEETAFELSAGVTAKLYAIARENRVTVNTMILAAWALLLGRYLGTDDVAFGAVRACRQIPVPDAASIVGLLINTVPVRVRIAEDEILSSLLGKLRAQSIAVREFEHTPLTQAQRCSDIPADQPLFNTLVNFQDPSWDSVLRSLGGKWLHRRLQIRSQPNYPIVLDVCGGPKLSAIILSNPNLCPSDSVARLSGHYRNLLESMVTNPFRKIGELTFFTALEEQQLMDGWACCERDIPRNRCVHHLVETQAAKAPGRIALADSRREMTYGELNTRANRLANRLKSLGIGPDVPVVVCMERSVEMILSWLAVLKAGGAFVPLDPAYPPERLATMCRDSRAPVFLTQERILDALPPLSRELAVVCVEANAGSFGRESDRNRADEASTGNLAYIIYTSGSSGQPKGVLVEHRSLANLVAWHQETYKVGPDDRATQLASPAFDASIWEVWPYLAAGASVHIPDQETKLSPQKLVSWLVDNRITLSFLPTPLAEAVMNEPWPRKPALRALLTGGDRLTRRPPKRFPCPVINHYGPTEVTVVATCSPVDPSPGNGFAPLIGRPIANARVYVLDRKFRPVPIGASGELYIGGEGLARGYLHQPELTAEKFIADPFDREGKGRLYRTGDQVRWLPHGELEFIGRLDAQVKIRGHRIETGEVEWALAQHAAVRQAVVGTWNDGHGTQLVAYLVSEFSDPPDPVELHSFLGRQLPDYMIPAQFVWLERLPMTANGKVDRRALPAPAGAPAKHDRTGTPQTAVESGLSKIWSDVLGKKSIGIHDSFFELGGHSLLAAQVIARMRTEFRVDLSVRALFDRPTIALLAPAIEEAERSEQLRAPIRRRSAVPCATL